MIAPARRAAYRVLRAVSAGDADLPAALDDVRRGLADPRDRALLTEIAAGTLRWQGRLDWLIERAAGRPLRKLDAEVLDILRLGLFQILFLDRVPVSAAVDDAVGLTRTAGKRSAAGFVNGVLRTLSRQRHTLGLPARPEGPDASREAALDYLSITGSHPRWLVARWLDRLGFEAADAWVAFNNCEAPLTIRANTLRTTREQLAAALSAAGVSTTPTEFAPEGLRVTAGTIVGNDAIDPSTFVIQDEASQLVPLMTGVVPGQFVFDACAAPGGKAIALAGALEGTGLLVAADVRPRRVALLRHLLSVAGATSVRVLRADLSDGVPLQQVFDVVLVDAPCSGLGTIRRDPEVRWRRREEDLDKHAARQRRLLASASAAVRPGGRLVYATCSSEPEENEAVIERFLADGAPFEVVSAHRLSSEGVPAGLLTMRGMLETRPDRDGLEAFFATALERVLGDEQRVAA
jgi:16S rRNA (cytosine967-C5)-methyltransferase